MIYRYKWEINVWIAVLIAIIITIALGFMNWINPEPVEGQKEKMCFNRFEDFVKERLKHINDTNYEILFQCDELNRSAIPEDESGK